MGRETASATEYAASVLFRTARCGMQSQSRKQQGAAMVESSC
jgi:hypothetical protein